MKEALKEKFKSNSIVKPLYRKLKNSNKIKPKMRISIDSTYELDGHAVSVKEDIVSCNDEFPTLKPFNKRKEILLRDRRKTYNKDLNNTNLSGIKGDANDITYGVKTGRMLGFTERKSSNFIVNKEHKSDKIVQTDTRVPSTWLRLYPMPKLPQESVCSVIFRCILCQLGISTFLVLWTMIFIFVIQSFEGPHELKISTDFEDHQNQLVIDLATELRQITPISPRWKVAIQRRIEDARRMTSAAVLCGARLRPGQYWDLSGTFLFSVYVMTALGFGAPVPQTIEGRTAALLYALLAVPSHFYLMLNVSTCIVFHVEVYMKQLRSTLQDKRLIVGIPQLANVKDSPNCSRNLELLMTSNRCCIGLKTMRFLSILGACRSVPLAGVLYYAAGACIFGVLRRLNPLDIIMFPLEFTTSGGLDVVAGHVRVLYGIYVEGAVILIACAFATVRRQSSFCVDHVSNEYRLFSIEQ